MEPYASNESPSTSSMLSNQVLLMMIRAMKTKEMVTEILKDSKGRKHYQMKKGSEVLKRYRYFKKVGEEI